MLQHLRCHSRDDWPDGKCYTPAAKNAARFDWEKWWKKSTLGLMDGWCSLVSDRWGQGSLPLLLRHIDMPRERISIVTGDERGAEEARHYGIDFKVTPLKRDNYRAVPRSAARQGGLSPQPFR